MRVEEVGVGPSGFAELAARADQRELVGDQLEGVVAVQHPGPEADLPAHRPARGRVSPLDQRVAYGLREQRRAVGRDLVARIEAPEVRDVAVAVLGIIPVLPPLLQLAVLADPHRRQATAHHVERVRECGVTPQDRRRARRVREKVGHELVVHRHARKDVGSHPGRVVLRRVGRRHHEVAGARILDEEVHEELRSALHQRIDLRQVFLVSVIEIAVPEVLAEPGTAARPEAAVGEVQRARDAPQVGIVVQHPAAAAVLARRDGAALREVADQRQQRLVQLRQVRQLGGPVVHLQVDVGRIIAAPGRGRAGVPDALQVGRLRAGLRAADQQIAAELEVGRHQRRIRRLAERADALVDRAVSGRRRAEVQPDPVELGLVGRHVRRESLAVFARSFLHISGVPRIRVAVHGLVVHEIGGQRDVQQQLRGALHEEPVARGAQLAALQRGARIVDIADGARDASLVASLALQAQQVASHDAHLRVRHRRRVEQLAAERLRPGGRQAHDDELVHERSEDFLDIFHPVHLVAGAHHRAVQIQLATVVAHFPAPAQEADLQRAGGLVGHFLAHGREEMRVAQFLRFIVAPGEDQVADLLQVLQALGIPVLVGAARGDGLLVELQLLHFGAAVDHRADAAVADRPRLFPIGSRPVKPERAVRSLRGKAAPRRDERRKQGQETFHIKDQTIKSGNGP